MGRSSLLVGNLKKKYAQGFLPEKLPQQDHTTTTDSEMEEPYLQGMHTVAGLKGRPHASLFSVSVEEP